MITAIYENRWTPSIARFVAAYFTFAFLPPSLYAYDPKAPQDIKEPEVKAPVSRKLTAKEMESSKGMAGNPYNAGQAKFDIVFQGVNTRTLNYTTAGNDLTFEGGFGIPISVTRSYSANNVDEGPFGRGWTLSADLRSTAGGMLKSSGSPDRSVPVDIRRRPSSETDPNVQTQPLEGVIITDAEGKQTTIQRDVDGILTTPPWEKNQYNPEYEVVIQNGNTYWVMISNETRTPDGTVYNYTKVGSYINGGSRPWNQVNATPEPNNVLKPTQVRDRQGNVTNLIYGSTPVQYVKSNGTTSELPLTRVEMPNGRFINFTYSGNRITQVSDNQRTVTYGYTNGYLTMVTSPGGKITRYGYDGLGAMNSITDPRGNVTQMFNHVRNDGAILTYRVELPNGYGYRFDYLVTDIAVPRGSQFTSDPTVSGFIPIVRYLPGQATPVRVPGGYVHYQGFNPSNNTFTVQELRFDGLPSFSNTGADLRRERVFHADSMDLVQENSWIRSASGVNPAYFDLSTTNRSYNFMGNPLVEESIERRVNFSNQNLVTPRTVRTDHAYWGKDKYFQKKATRMTAGNVTRYSFTEYFDENAPAGKRGQTHRVYDTKYGGIYLNTSAAVPSWAPATSAWRYQVAVQDPNKFSGEFDYDAQGRTIQVRKLQRVVDGQYQYVTTNSTYGANGAPAFGGAIQVVEDAGGANRTTQTLEFDVAGRATKTVDGAGKLMQTVYDGDGLVQSITQINTVPPTPIVSYTYGTTDGTPENGQVIAVIDELSGVSQGMTFVQSGPARGMPATATMDAGGGQVSTSTYSYNAEGDRILTVTQTPNGSTAYRYKNFEFFGLPTSENRVFTRINQQRWVSSAWVDGREEVRYGFDAIGRIRFADFAMTPQGGAQDYNAQDAAESFARAAYTYDMGGRVTAVEHWWNQRSGNTYISTPVRATSAEFNSPLALKTATKVWTPNGTGFALQRTETYGYDADLDYLTSVNYGDNSPTQTWQYDAAGNRSFASATPGTWSYDNLNRMTASPWETYGHDALGNRMRESNGGAAATEYRWDQVNRMIYRGPEIRGDLTGHRYVYRADGMRVRKQNQVGLDLSGQIVANLVNNQVTRTYYEGQMPLEEDVIQGGSVQSLTRNFLGGRGLEAITTTENNVTTTAYPLYDTHGNMVATLTKNASGTSWNVGNERWYDVWGGVRSGSATGGPKGRYCANLGHVQDDESGLIYMRARYYEPSTGRFISEDPACAGTNWYIYANSNPLRYHDPSGKVSSPAGLPPYAAFMASLGILATILAIAVTVGNYKKKGTEESLDAVSKRAHLNSQILAQGFLLLAAFSFSEAISNSSFDSNRLLKFINVAHGFSSVFATIATGLEYADAARGLALASLIAATAYSAMAMGLLINIYMGPD